MRKALLALLVALFALAQPSHAQYVTLTGTIQSSNGLPAQNYTLTFKPSQMFWVAGTGAVVPESSTCGTSVDGTVVGLPNPTQAPLPSAGFTGTLPAGNYYVEYTYQVNSTETMPSPEAQVQLTATGNLTVPVPRGGIPAAAAGMNVYIGTASGQETLQATTVGATPWVQSAPLNTSSNAPPGNNTTICQQVANDAGWPTGTSYNVALSDPSGNMVPSYPMRWQLLGPGTTLNLSNGLPYYNGTVTFPAPIVATPFNHNTQSISGGLNLGRYPLTAGAVTSCSSNSVLTATCPQFQGVDIGDMVNKAFASCSFMCTVYVPAGNYSFSTQISLPLNTFGVYFLWLDQAAQLHYTGSAEAITTTINTSPTGSNLRISGGSLYGTASATAGIHVLPSNGVSITDMLIFGFSNGPGLWLDGVNGATVFDNTIQSNQDGVKLSPTYCSGTTCGTGISGSGFTPNQILVVSNRITNNQHWGINSTDPVTAGLTGALNDYVLGNDLELNGLGGSSYGALFFGRSHGLIVDGNYFEGSPRQVVLGIAGGSDSNQFRFYASQGPQIINNYFTDEAATPFDIELLDTADAQINGNSTNYVSGGAGDCFVNTLTNNGVNIGETGTFFGKNHVENYGTGRTTLCIAGAAVSTFVGAGSYNQVNTNYILQISNANYAIANAGTSETVAAPNANAGSSCLVGPLNSAAGTVAAQSYFIPSGPNTGTLYHPSGAVGVRVNIFCAPSPYN